ncbi:hypothetical protein MASR1M32_11930 [Rhodobacter sp.]
MKLTTRQDIEAPLDFVHAKLTDFDQFERMAMRRGAEVERTDRMRTTGPGMAWKVRFAYRRRQRAVQVRLTDSSRVPMSPGPSTAPRSTARPASNWSPFRRAGPG